jgi:hypothetical protein
MALIFEYTHFFLAAAISRPALLELRRKRAAAGFDLDAGGLPVYDSRALGKPV